MSKNKNLHKAKKEKNDEFYTLLSDIEKEMVWYKDFFKDKVVYCNCDDARESNFFKYFSENFELLGLKKLITTGYIPGGHGVVLEYSGDKNGDFMVGDDEITTQTLAGDGDFRSPECIEFLKQADVVVTNPPFSCYSFDTEVLTNHGWKYIKDVNIDSDIIYSLNPNTNDIELVKAVDYIKSPVNGHLYHFSSHNMDFMVTGNHKMYNYYRDGKGDIILGENKNAEDIKKSHLLKLTGFNWSGRKIDKFILPGVVQKKQYSRKDVWIEDKVIDMKSWLEFFGFYLADGCYRDGLNSNGDPRYIISIKQNSKNQDYVLKLFNDIGFSCKIRTGSDGNNNYEVYSKQLWTYLKQFGRSEDKYIPREILELDKEYLECLFKGYYNGDSYCVPGGKHFSSRSKLLMDNIQEIILKLYGNITKVRTIKDKYRGEDYTYYGIHFTENTEHRKFCKYGNPEIVDYNDYVYCLTLERNHIMLVRRNNTIGWCGNCFREYIGQLMGYEKKFIVLGNGNAVTCKEIFPLIKDNKIWLGASKGIGGKFCFAVPDTYAGKFVSEVDGIRIAQINNACWFTNVDYEQRHDKLDLCKKYNPTDYPKYDNYDAIDSKTDDIPEDYFGVIGVPITFLDKYCSEQFNIVGLAAGNSAINNFGINAGYVKHKDDRGGCPILNGNRVYSRFLIRRK